MESIFYLAILILYVSSLSNAFKNHVKVTPCRPNSVSSLLPRSVTPNKAGKPLFVRTRLYLDIFGLGPSEIAIVFAAAAFIYGPDRLKKQLNDKGN